MNRIDANTLMSMAYDNRSDSGGYKAIFNKLKKEIAELQNKVYGTDIATKFAAVYDKIYDHLEDLNLDTNVQDVLRLLKGSQFATKQLKQIFNDNLNKFVSIEPDRYARYKEFEMYYFNIPFVAAILRIYIDNTLQPNFFRESIFSVKIEDIDDTLGSGLSTATIELQQLQKNIRMIIEYLNLDTIIQQPISDMYLKGDGFLELVDLSYYARRLEQLTGSADTIESNTQLDDISYHVFQVKLNRYKRVKLNAITSRTKQLEKLLFEKHVLAESAVNLNTNPKPDNQIELLIPVIDESNGNDRNHSLLSANNSNLSLLHMSEAEIEQRLIRNGSTSKQKSKSNAFEIVYLGESVVPTFNFSIPASQIYDPTGQKSIWSVFQPQTTSLIDKDWNQLTQPSDSRAQLKPSDFVLSDPSLSNLQQLNNNSKQQQVSKEDILKQTVQDMKQPFDQADFEQVHDDIQSSLQNIRIVYHPPENILLITLGKTVLGALAIYVGGSQTIEYNAQLAKQLFSVILQQVITGTPEVRAELENNPEYINQLVQMLNDYALQAKPNDKVIVKFIPNSRLIHFRLPISHYDPYGESIFEPVKEYLRYLYAALKALLVYRLTRAIEKRLIYFEIGADPDTESRIQELREEMTKRKYAIASGELDALEEIVTLFDDIWLPMRQGQDFVRIDILPAGDFNTKLDDLKWLQSQIIAVLGIPFSLLDPEQLQEERKYLLADVNARFANTIIRAQKAIEKPLNKLIKEIYRRVFSSNSNMLQFAKITLQPPYYLILDKLNDIFNNISSVVSAIGDTAEIPKEYLLKKFTPFLDWEALQTDVQIENKIRALEKSNKSQEEASGTGEEEGFGGFGI